MNDEQPLDGTAGLPRRIEPPRDLWPGIAERIAQKRVVSPTFGGTRPARRWMRPVLLAAAAIALVVMSSVVTLSIVRRDAGITRLADRAVVVVGQFADLEAEYQGASEELLRTVRRGEVQLSPWTLTVLERNLRIIDEAIQEARDALAGDPANEALRHMVLGTYRQKLDLLRRTAAARL